MYPSEGWGRWWSRTGQPAVGGGGYWVNSSGLRVLGASSPVPSLFLRLCSSLFILHHHSPPHFMSTSKSSTSSLVSSVPLRLPTAHTSLVLEARMRHTTPPLPPLSRVTKLRMNSPVFRSHSLTVPSSELVMTKFLLNWRHVTALWCLWGPGHTKTRDRGMKCEGPAGTFLMADRRLIWVTSQLNAATFGKTSGRFWHVNTAKTFCF